MSSQTLKLLSDGKIKCCIETTLVDGLVLAKAAFHHSINYRVYLHFLFLPIFLRKNYTRSQKKIKKTNTKLKKTYLGNIIRTLKITQHKKKPKN